MDRDEGGSFSKAPDWKPLFLIKLTYLLDGNFICKSMLMSSGCRNSSTIFGGCWKLLSEKASHNFTEVIVFSWAFPASWVIYNECALHMMYKSIPYWDILPREENSKNSYNSLKYWIFEEEFNNSSGSIL